MENHLKKFRYLPNLPNILPRRIIFELNYKGIFFPKYLLLN